MVLIIVDELISKDSRIKRWREMDLKVYRRRTVMENKNLRNWVRVSEMWLDEWIVGSVKFEELLKSGYEECVSV